MKRYEALTVQFYAWEQRLRGWEAYPFPVDIEPPFEPFFYHSVPVQSSVIDDSFRPSVFTRAYQAIKSVASSGDEIINEEPADDSPLVPFIWENDAPLIALSVSLPKDQKIRPDEIEQLLFMLSQSIYPISFEIIATQASIRIQFVCREPDANYVHNQVKAYFPTCGIHEASIGDIVAPGGRYFRFDFGLEEECMRPLATPKSFDVDPLTGIFGVLENLTGGEQLVIQILFKGVANPWAESIIRSVMDNEGGSFFLNAPEMVKLAQEKISVPLFAVCIRVIGYNTDNDTQRLANGVIQATQSPYNSLFPLNDGYYSQGLEDVMSRQSHRLGMLLNSKELATLVHFPSVSVVSHKLERDTRKTKAAPPAFLNHQHIFGANIHQGNISNVTISETQRLKHTHIIGATGTGKSTLLLSSIIQDMANGEGIAVLDPHGDLIDSILSWVHPNRHKDVIVIDPSDTEFPVGFNILTAHSEIEKDILSSDLVAAFKRLSTSWGDQMNSVFANAILAFLESTKGGTLVDLRRFLIEKSFRDKFLLTVADPSIVYYWHKEFPILKSSSIGPILTRLDSFLRPKLIRNMVAQQKSLDFEHILDSKKIVLIKLSQGLMGTENSYLLGTFLVSKIQQAAMARQAKQKADRSNFYLYIDEFQNFITPSMSAILSGARKYHLGLILVHQDMQQLTKHDAELASAVTANAGTRICFRLGDTDAKRFEGGFSFFDADDLQNLDAGEAIIRIERPENNCNLQTLPFEVMEQDVAREIKERVIDFSRNNYGTPKEEVEALLKNIHSVHEYPTEKETIKATYIPTHKPTTASKPAEPFVQSRLKNPEDKKQETQHRYLQTLIKRMAESRGYTAFIEEPTPDGRGKVDVSLKRNNKLIAVEINDTSKDVWELHNIEKCLAAGYDMIVACSTDSQVRARMTAKIEEKFEIAHREKMLVLSPDSLFLYLDSEIAKDASNDIRVKGYRVKVDYTAVPEQEMDRKREMIARSVIDAMKEKRM
ncbi:type IV secretion system DNA-binding domain-containing protein [Mucilaginibacter sp.]|uniref:type IV secretory system conjugative DNA transfer family protein n=1 Tax=Mucilaginibacter sp. TaxID=1882438 RepID=UPI0025D782BB|nr:type IV secretion system DNA-binding domain-containing protein [Mucilaginibacter sp.]